MSAGRAVILVVVRLDVRRVAFLCAGISVATAGTAAAAVLSIRAWQPSVLIRMGATEPIAAFARASDSKFEFVNPEGHGDGSDYYAIARDPVASGQEHRVIDDAAYRYGHPGFSWVALAASGGRPSLLPLAFLLVGLAGMGLAAGTASLVASGWGWSPWSGLFVALQPGLVYAVTIDTSEPLGVGVLALVALFWQRGRWKGAIPLLVFLCFVKEWFVVVPLALAGWEAVQWRRRGGGKETWRRLTGLALSPVPLSIWHVYLRTRFGEWPAQAAPPDFDIPPLGWLRTIRGDANLGIGNFDQINVGHVGLPILVATAAVLLIGTLRALPLRTPVDAIFLAFMPIVVSLNSLTLLYPKDLLRTLAVPMTLLPAVVAGERARGRS
jgi:hypothetical protein